MTEGDGTYPNWIIEFSQEIYDTLAARLPNLIVTDQSTGERFSFRLATYALPARLENRTVYQTSLTLTLLPYGDGEDIKVSGPKL